jgi:hypothetical protein
VEANSKVGQGSRRAVAPRDDDDDDDDDDFIEKDTGNLLTYTLHTDVIPSANTTNPKYGTRWNERWRIIKKFLYTASIKQNTAKY